MQRKQTPPHLKNVQGLEKNSQVTLRREGTNGSQKYTDSLSLKMDMFNLIS